MMANLDLGSLHQFKSSCKDLQILGNSLYERRVQRVLRLFKVDLVVPFITLLRDYDAVVVGDVPLLLTFPHSIIPQSIIVLVPGAYISTFAIHLSTSFKWVLESENLNGLWTFKKDGMCLYLSKAPGSAITRMGNAATTAQMMFLSSKGVYIAYPSLTFDKRALTHSVSSRSNWIHSDAHMQPISWIDYKPNLDSWSDLHDHICTKDWSCPKTMRRLHDRGSFFWAFDKEIERDGHIYDGVRGVVWHLNHVQCAGLGHTHLAFSKQTFTCK